MFLLPYIYIMRHGIGRVKGGGRAHGRFHVTEEPAFFDNYSDLSNYAVSRIQIY